MLRQADWIGSPPPLLTMTKNGNPGRAFAQGRDPQPPRSPTSEETAGSYRALCRRDIRMIAYHLALRRRRNAARTDLEDLRARRDRRKRRRVGAGHPDLRVERGERIVERGAAG